jgi:RNase P protein component
VERNALRRRIRESVRQLRPVLGSYDYNVVINDFERPVRKYARRLAKEITQSLTDEVFVEAHSRSSAKLKSEVSRA